MAASCPKCNATIVDGMLTCQFCGASVDFKPAAEESWRVETPAEESQASEWAGGKSSGDKAAMEAATQEPVAAASTDRAPADPATSVPVAPVSKPAMGGLKKVFLYYILPPIGAVIAIFVVLRIVSMSPMTGTTGSSQSSDAADSSTSANAGGLGVEVYPGAHAASDVKRDDSGDGSVVTQSFSTSDPMKVVIEFYKTKMVGYASIYADGAGVVCSFSPSAKESVRVGISPDSSGGETRIFITHTTSKSSN